MSRLTYLQCSLTLPIVVPVVLTLLMIVLNACGLAHVEKFNSTVFFLMYGTGLGGLPCVACAALTLRALRSRSVRSYYVASFLAAPVFSLVMFVVFSCVGLASSFPMGEAVFLGFCYGAWSLGVAAFYVLLTHALLAVLTCLRVVEAPRVV